MSSDGTYVPFLPTATAALPLLYLFLMRHIVKLKQCVDTSLNLCSVQQQQHGIDLLWIRSYHLDLVLD